MASGGLNDKKRDAGVLSPQTDAEEKRLKEGNEKFVSDAAPGNDGNNAITDVADFMNEIHQAGIQTRGDSTTSSDLISSSSSDSIINITTTTFTNTTWSYTKPITSTITTPMTTPTTSWRYSSRDGTIDGGGHDGATGGIPAVLSGTGGLGGVSWTHSMMEQSPSKMTFEEEEPLTHGKALEILRGNDQNSDMQSMMANLMTHLSGKMDNGQKAIHDQFNIHNDMLGSITNNLQKVNQKTETHSIQISQLQTGHDELKERVDKLELYSRYGNLIISGVPEDIKDLSNWYHNTLLYDLGLKDRDETKPQTIVNFDKIHRLGVERKPNRTHSSPTRALPRPRKVLVKFKSHSDRELIWNSKGNLSGSGIYLEEHLPESYEERRKPLYNIASIARKKGKLDGTNTKATVREDYLLIDGKRYTANQLYNLPPTLDDAKHHCLVTDRQVSFLGFLCPLSNFYSCTFTHNGEKYTSSEQFIQMTKARRFNGNEYLQQQIMNTHEPIKIKNLGHRVRNFDEDIWRTEAVDLLYEGLKSKFTQCEVPFNFLKSTGVRLIVEASKSDKLFGVGQAITSDNILNPATFQGKNIQGNLLMTIRDDVLSSMSCPRPSSNH
jgi:hypothetical protein